MNLFDPFHGAEWWESMQAFGTLGAVIVALGLPLVGYFSNRKVRKNLRREAHRRTASLVSAWVETSYTPAERGKYFAKKSTLYIANESDEPVFQVVVDVAAGEPLRQVGPLSAPSPIPVLPARRQRSFDISMGLLAHETPEEAISLWEPAARISFHDRHNTVWVRDYDGSLHEERKLKREVVSDEAGIQQLGVPSNLNPMAVAFDFHQKLISDNPPTPQEIRPLLDDEAIGWDRFDQETVNELREVYSACAMPVHVWYRTDRVAYVRLVQEASIPVKRNMKTPTNVSAGAQLITLVFRRNKGWKIFATGAVSAEWIEFQDGELHEDVRSYLTDD